jgi:small subunit ribosomal protein S10
MNFGFRGPKIFDKRFLSQLLIYYFMVRVRVKLNSTDVEMLNEICNSIKDIALKSGIIIKGPVPLPTKRLKITTRKSPCGNGTATFDRFEMRIHKRVIDLPANDKVLHSIMRLNVPRSVNIKIEMKD